jgi:hypothetical protein
MIRGANMMNPSALTLFLGSLFGADLPADFTLLDPPGAHVGTATADQPQSGQFRAGTPVIATSYFYWYDARSGSHVIDHDGTDALTDHPPTLRGFSYQIVDWHASQLSDMMAAGIDVLLPVYWGTPLGDFGFSDQGMPKLVEARKRFIAQGKRPPSIGMFYDTSTLRHNSRGYHVDLTTPAGRLWFYGTIRNFFSHIPAQHRATIDGKPLVFLYASAFAKEVDGSLFPAVREMFRRDFGCDLFLVKMRGWPGKADSEYNWGGALAPQLLETAGLGPGYDHSAVPGRAPLVRSRDEGRFYAFAWQRLLAMDSKTRPWLVHVETWNEYHEGTEICETAEYGRQYIELTRQFADQFHVGHRIDLSKIQPSRKVISASPDQTEGLWVVPKADGDGSIAEKTIAGRKAWSTTQNRYGPARYMYFEVEDYFLFDGDETVVVTVAYYDAGPNEFYIEYDSCDPALAGLQQQFRPGSRQSIAGTETWKEATFTIPHARFAGRSNLADFRLTCTNDDLVISHVSIRRAQRE